MKVFDFEVKSTLKAEVISHEGKYYMRTREVAQILGVKQQYEFNADIKRNLGSRGLLKGEDTLDFRGLDDTDRTTFIEFKKLIKSARDSALSFKESVSEINFIPGSCQEINFLKSSNHELAIVGLLVTINTFLAFSFRTKS